MEKKRILITGANGFVGLSLIENFDLNRYELFALDCQSQLCEVIKARATYLEVDIRNPFQLDQDFDIVIHLAALNRTNIDSDFSYDQFKAINVIGTQNTLKSCRYRKFILVSSAHIYDKSVARIDETTPLKPTSFYERSKYEAELVCQANIPADQLIILRPVNITGLNQKNIAMVPFFFSKAVNNEAIEVFVPQNRKVQLLSIRDLFHAIEKMLSQESLCGAFNLASQGALEVREIASRIVKLCDSRSAVNCTNSALEDFAEIRTDKARRVLNWEAEDSIEMMLNDYARFLFGSK